MHSSNKGRETGVRRKVGVLTETPSKAPPTGHDAQHMLEDILGKPVNLKDGLKISTYAAHSMVSNSKSVRFSFGKEEIDSNSLPQSRSKRPESKQPIKPALLSKKKQLQQYGEEPSIGPLKQTSLHATNNFITKGISPHKRLALSKRDKQLRIEDEEKNYKRSLTEYRNTGMQEGHGEEEEQMGDLAPKASLNSKRRHSHHSLSLSPQVVSDKEFIENYLDKQSFSDDHESDTDRLFTSQKVKNIDSFNLMKSQKPHTKPPSSSETSTHCGNLKTGQKKPAPDCDAAGPQPPCLETDKRKLLLDSIAPLDIGLPERAAKPKLKEENFTIKEEPSCIEEYLTPNASANHESKSNNQLEEDNLEQADAGKLKYRTKQSMFDSILRIGTLQQGNKNITRSQTTPLLLEPIVLMKLDDQPEDSQPPLATKKSSPPDAARQPASPPRHSLPPSPSLQQPADSHRPVNKTSCCILI